MLWILGIFAAAAILVLLTSYICFRMAFHARPDPGKDEEYPIPPGKVYAPHRPVMMEWMDKTRQLPCREFSITSFDGLKLRGRYYEFATVSTPEGYAAVEGELGILSDENENSFSFEAEDENKAVQTVYTVGVKNRTAEEMLNMVSGSFNYEVQTENKTATIGGHEVHYFYGQGLESEESPDVFISTMTCYVDSVEGSCVLVSLASKEGALEELPSEEAMLADAEGIFASIKINK